MAPKRARKATSSSANYDKSRFPDQTTYNRYVASLSSRKLIPERVFDIVEGTFPDIDRIISDRGWHNLCRVDPGSAVIPIVREFYAIATTQEDGKVQVRGKEVEFTKAAINRHFQIPPVAVNEFIVYSENPNLDEVIQLLCPYRTTWDNKHFPKGDMSNSAKSWFYFICARLLPALHHTDVTKERALLIYCILTGKVIDVGGLIHGMIKYSVNTRGASMFFPSLITSLCRQAGIVWDPSEELLQPAPPLTRQRILRLNAPTDKDAPPPTHVSSPSQPGPSMTVKDRLAAVEASLHEHRQEFQQFRTYQVDCNQSLHQMMQQCAISMGVAPTQSVPWPSHPVPSHFSVHNPEPDEDADN